MIKDINLKLNKVKNNKALKDILETKIEEMKKQLNINKDELNELTKKLKKEKRDVDKLKKISLANIVASIMNNKDEKLDKENEEYLIVKLKYDEMVSKVNLLEEDLESEKKRLNELGSCEEEYKILIEEKANYIKNYGDSEIKEKLLVLDNRIDYIIRQNKELEEAYNAGSNLITAINLARNSLTSAKNWGIYDIAGGDFLSSMIKHNKINEASEQFKKISYLISRFNKELGDISLEDIKFSSTTITFDIFFDNIFTDFSVQNKINDAISNIDSLKRRVDSVMSDLRSKKNIFEDELNNIKKEYQQYIELV